MGCALGAYASSSASHFINQINNDSNSQLATRNVKLQPNTLINSLIYRSMNGSPSENLTKVVELMGGIKKIIGSDDVILIKPNVQWWNQGAPNLAALKTFVDLIMERPGGFRGEVVIAENCHRGSSP